MHTRPLLLSRALLLGLLCTLLGALWGCATPRAEFLRAECRRVQRDGELGAVAFTSRVATNRLAGQQLIFKVNLVDSRYQPIRSGDGRYEDAAGNVAASKALMVLESPWTFERVEVSIPADELEVDADDRPVFARFGIYDPEGAPLAQTIARLPLPAGTAVARATPRRGARPAAERGQAKEPVAPVPAGEADAPVPDRPVAVRERPESATELLARWQRPISEAQTWTNRAASLLVPPADSPEPAVTVQPPPDEPPAATSQPATRPSPRASMVERTATQPLRRQEVSKEPTTQPSTAPTRVVDVPTPEEKPPAFRWYVVRKGDNLTRIALNLLGDASRWREIYELNQDQLASPDRIWEGMELRIPLASRDGQNQGSPRPPAQRP